MYRVQIHMKIDEGLLLTNKDEANSIEKVEITLESVVASALLEMFGSVLVHEVEASLIYSSSGTDKLEANITLMVPEETLKVSSKEERTIEGVELAIENALTTALLDLFESVQINKVVIVPEKINTSQTTLEKKTYLTSLAKVTLDSLATILIFIIFALADILLLFIINFAIKDIANPLILNILEGFKFASLLLIFIAFAFQFSIIILRQVRFNIKIDEDLEKTPTLKSVE